MRFTNIEGCLDFLEANEALQLKPKRWNALTKSDLDSRGRQNNTIFVGSPQY